MVARRFEETALIALLVFGTLSAIAGGIALIAGSIDLPSEWLVGTIFSSYAVPGAILALVVGGSQLFAVIATYRRDTRFLYAAALAGSFLMGWIIGELIIVGSDDAVMFGLQLLYFLIGFLEFAIANVVLRQGAPSR